MNIVEKEYRERMNALTGTQRVARAAALLEGIRSMLRQRIMASMPDLDESEVRLKVAEALYRTDSRAQKLIRRLSGARR